MLHANEVHTPMCPNNVLNLLDDTSFLDSIGYRSIVNGLQ